MADVKARYYYIMAIAFFIVSAYMFYKSLLATVTQPTPLFYIGLTFVLLGAVTLAHARKTSTSFTPPA